MKIIEFIFLWLCFSLVCAQTDTVRLQGKIYLPDVRLEDDVTNLNHLNINDSIIHHTPTSLTDILRFQTPVYLKENGFGMPSSPSFRGTTAQQTAVLWNGINVNSAFLGQTDFNTFFGSDYNQIVVKPGGGSTVYGSGVMGGSIHLNNLMKFDQGIQNQIGINYGSFNTWNTNYKFKFSNDKWSLATGYRRYASDNNFELDEVDYTNLNGEFENQTLHLNLARQFSNQNILSFYSQYYWDDRHFSLIKPNEVKTKYKNNNLRLLTQWQRNGKQLRSIVKAAYIYERFRYYSDIDADYASFGEANNFILTWDGKYKFGKNKWLSALVESNYISGDGSSMGNPDRWQGSGALLWNHQLNNKIAYEAGIKKEIVADYDSPLLYSFGINYKPFQIYELSLNYSRNFRAPTFNDLYWTPGGNLDLKAENSHQFDLAQNVKRNNVNLTVSIYFNRINDMIQWLPEGGNYWTPINHDKVETYGIETHAEFFKTFGKHTFTLVGNYAYTVSENKSTGKQLIYVPYHKANASFSYNYNRISAYTQALFVGETFVTTDNSSAYTVEDYTVFNIGGEYALGKKKQYLAGFKINNLFNTTYQSVENRYMPGINNNFYIKLNF